MDSVEVNSRDGIRNSCMCVTLPTPLPSVHAYVRISRRGESLVNAAHAHKLTVRIVDGLLVAFKTYVENVKQAAVETATAALEAAETAMETEKADTLRTACNTFRCEHMNANVPASSCIVKTCNPNAQCAACVIDRTRTRTNE